MKETLENFLLKGTVIALKCTVKYRVLNYFEFERAHFYDNYPVYFFSRMCIQLIFCTYVYEKPPLSKIDPEVNPLPHLPI